MMIRIVVCVVFGCLVFSSCAAGYSEYPSTVDPSTPASTKIPSSGESLASIGFTHEPASQIWLPTRIRLTYAADQENLLIVTGTMSEASVVEAYLKETLPGLGWEITSESDGALMFTQDSWHGAYVEGDQSWALTIRND